MKRILALSAIVFLVALSQYTTLNAQSFLGAGLVLASQTGTAIGLEARGVIDIPSIPNLDIAPDFQYYFANSGSNFALIDANVHYVFANFRAGGGFYGLVGLAIAVINGSGVGLNLGAGVMGDIGGVSAYGDLKLIFGGGVGAGTPLVISAGLLFPL